MEDKILDINKIKETVRINQELDENSDKASSIKIYSVRFLVVVSLILSLLNAIKGYHFMEFTTLAMAGGFAFCSWLYNKKRKIKLANYILAFMIMLIFTYYAASGQNEGFAILWILMIPPISSNILNLKFGLFVSAYFQLVLFVLFYSPLKAHYVDVYTGTFMIRFPVLYFATLIVSFLIVFEKEFYAIKTYQMAHTDALTKLRNRRTFAEKMKETSENWASIEDITILVFDLNGLKRVNDNIGHAAGDDMIIAAADCIRKAFKDAAIVARVGGDEYAVITEQTEAVVKQEIEHLNKLAADYKSEVVDEMTISTGYACKKDHQDITAYELYNLADKAMYDSKRQFYEESGHDRRSR